MTGNKKLQVWLPLLFSLVMIAGMFFGYKLGSKGGKNNFFSSNRRSSLQEALDIIRYKYVDSVQIDSLQGRAIEEMMNELDPHSVYLPPVDLKIANEDLAGKFDGIGVEFNVFNDTVNIVYVIPGGPSDNAGLMVGDKILKVNDSSLTKKNISTDEIKSLIRGPGGSNASLLIKRGPSVKIYTIKRGRIPVSPIDAAYLIDKNTGYIRLNKFSDGCYREFMTSLEPMTKQGIKQLVLDLRGNGGGFMNEAVEMADEFLDGDKLIVYTEGVNSRRQEYRCKRPGLFEQGKLVVLVDELSASASEVLAGALQDWCRATIIGRRTFGKGLVQQPYGLSDGSAIRLTIARYYTPLGRSIQKSYEKGKKVYMDELWDRFNSGEMISADSLRSHNGGKRFTNSCKDTLYAGDGITPQVFVPIDTSHSQQKILNLTARSAFNTFLYKFFLDNKSQMDRYTNAREFVTRFNAAGQIEKMMSNAPDSLRLKQITGKERDILFERIKALLARYKWRNEGFFEVLNETDPSVLKALEVLAK